MVEGWIAADVPSEEAYVEALAEGETPFGRARAEPGADGRLHFSIEIPPALRDGRVRFLDVRPLGGGRPLPGSPLVFDGGLFDAARAVPATAQDVRAEDGFAVEGQASLSPPGLVEGWAWAPDHPERRLRLEVLAGERFLATITADKPREDLKASGVGDGLYGFWFDASRLLRRGPHLLTIRVEGASRPLAGCPLRVGPFAADGEADCPGYLDDEPSRSALDALPFEHLAYDARRIAPDRLVPRLINRLRREREAAAAASALPALLVVAGESGAVRRAWDLQSWPLTSLVEASAGPESLRGLFARADRVFFAEPQDLIHPSAAAIVAGHEADVVTWNRFCADEARAGSAGAVLRRPDFDAVSARHGAFTDTTLAVRGELLARAPGEVLEAICAGRMHPLWFWLAGEDLSFSRHPEALTSSVGAPALPDRRQVEADEDFYRRRLAEEGGAFTLERTTEDLPFPHVLVPARRARLVSVLIPFRDRQELTLRCLSALARQRLTGELEVVLVDNQSRPEQTQAVMEGARRLFGEGRVRLIPYDKPFSHSAENNLAARAASGEAVVFCNNDVVVKDPSLIEQITAWALQPGIGAVGCRLEDPERGIGSYGHAFAAPSPDPFQPPLRENSDPFFGRLVHAVPGATLALAAFERERFLGLGGLDGQRFPIGYNDIDLMLRASRTGLRHLFLGCVFAEHVRGSSRTGDNEDLQALLINQAFPEAAAGRLGQFALERIETLREDLSSSRPVDAPPKAAKEAGELAALQAEIDARQAQELKRAEIAEAYVRASELVRSLGEELSAARGIGG